MQNRILFGINSIREVIKNPSIVQKVLIQNKISNPEATHLKQQIIRSGISYSFVPEQKLHKQTK